MKKLIIAFVLILAGMSGLYPNRCTQLSVLA